MLMRYRPHQHSICKEEPLKLKHMETLTQALAQDQPCRRSALHPLSGWPASLRASRPSSRGGSSCMAAAFTRPAKAGRVPLRCASSKIIKATSACRLSCNQQSHQACLH